MGALAHAADSAAENRAAQSPPSWSSPSLRSETVVGPNGAVTTRAALLANEKWGIGDTKRIERVTDGVYAMRGWGIASSFAIEAPGGWIIVDTGDFTRAAAEMRAKLEETLGRKVKVAAIPLTWMSSSPASRCRSLPTDRTQVEPARPGARPKPPDAPRRGGVCAGGNEGRQRPGALRGG